MSKEQKKNPPPEKKFRAGPITATVWKSKDENRKTRLVVFDKSYKDKESNEWKTTNNFTAQDLPAIAWLSRQAFEYITRKE